MPIGGADMPVVISLLNSFTGVAAAMGGFLYNNQAMLTGGILVGSAGTILTVLMCKAMNRSLLNVIVGVFGGGGEANIGLAEGLLKRFHFPMQQCFWLFKESSYCSRLWTCCCSGTAYLP